MLRTKIRNATIGLIAASSLAVVIAPAASAAPVIPGRFAKSAEGIKAMSPTLACYGDHERYNQLVNAAEEFLLENKTEGAIAATAAAAHIRETAKNGGCGWAQ
jgi:hypothetical protein